MYPEGNMMQCEQTFAWMGRWILFLSLAVFNLSNVLHCTFPNAFAKVLYTWQSAKLFNFSGTRRSSTQLPNSISTSCYIASSLGAIYTLSVVTVEEEDRCFLQQIKNKNPILEQSQVAEKIVLNIARIANAVQVTICLLVSTSVY